LFRLGDQIEQSSGRTFTGTLIFDNDTLDLLTTSDKKELLLELKELTDLLKVGVEDRTTPQHYWIDMAKY
jgi:hypothetical protein